MGHKTLIQDNYIPTAAMADSLSRSTPMVDLDWSTHDLILHCSGSMEA